MPRHRLPVTTAEVESITQSSLIFRFSCARNCRFVGPDGLGIAGADIPLQQALGMTSAPATAAAAAAAPAPAAAPASIGGVPLAHVPSAKEIEDAVEELDDDAHGQHQHHAAAPTSGAASMPAPAAPALQSSSSTDSDVGAGSSAGSGSGGVTSETGLNAFEIINMFGGMALNRLLEVAPGAAAAAAGGGAERRGPSASHPQFLSTHPANAILSKLASALQEMHAEVRQTEV